MEVKEQIKLRFLGVDFPSVQFSSAQQYISEKSSEPLLINIIPKAFLPKDRLNVFHIIMNVEISLKGFFDLKIIGIGYFELPVDSVTEEQRRAFINANSVAIVFPYVRSFVATLTANLGDVMTPIILPAQFFKGELEEYILPEDSAAEVAKLH